MTVAVGMHAPINVHEYHLRYVCGVDMIDV
jgi:hypothetical protein